MAIYIAIQQVYTNHLVNPGEEFEIELAEGQEPPPVSVAVLKKSKAGKAAIAELTDPDTAA